MELKLLLGVIFSVIVVYYIIRVVFELRQKKPILPTDPVEEFKDSSLGTFKLLMEEPDDWEWSTPMAVGNEYAELRVSGYERPDECILLNAKKLKGSISSVTKLIESNLYEEWKCKVRKYHVFTFISVKEPDMLTVRLLADDNQEYQCIIDCSSFKIISPPSLF